MNVNSERADRSARWLLLIFVVALGSRLAMAFWLPEAVIWPDGKRYEKVALSIVHGDGFGDIVQNRLSVPTQPLLIAGVYSVFGEKNYLALRVVCAVIGALSVVLGFLLARSLFGSAAAICTGILLAGYPHLIYLSALFEYPQVLFLLLLPTFFLLHRKFIDNRKLWILFAAGLCLGISVLTVPSVLLFVPVWGLLLITRDVRETAVRACVVTLAMCVTIGAWATRNYLEYGTVMLINKASSTNLWAANNETYARYGKPGIVPPCAPGYEHTAYCVNTRALWASVRAKGFTGVARVNEEERLARENAMAWIRAEPAEFAKLAVLKFFRLWSPLPDAVNSGGAHGGGLRDLVATAAYIPLLLLGIAGLVLAARTHWRTLVPIYAFIVVFITPFAIFLPTMRYRLPMDFLLAIFASYALVQLWEVVRRRRGRSHELQPA